LALIIGVVAVVVNKNKTDDDNTNVNNVQYATMPDADGYTTNNSDMFNTPRQSSYDVVPDEVGSSNGGTAFFQIYTNLSNLGCCCFSKHFA
jgi:hypothetical protein